MFHCRSRNRTNAYLFAFATDQIIEFSDTRLFCDDKQVGFAHRHRKITKFSHVELDGGTTKELLQYDGSRNVADDGTVFRRCVESMICRDNAPGAGHIVDDDGWIAGNVFGYVSGDQPRILIVAPTGGKPNDDPHRPATVKVSNGLFI